MPFTEHFLTLTCPERGIMEPIGRSGISLHALGRTLVIHVLSYGTTHLKLDVALVAIPDSISARL